MPPPQSPQPLRSSGGPPCGRRDRAIDGTCHIRVPRAFLLVSLPPPPPPQFKRHVGEDLMSRTGGRTLRGRSSAREQRDHRPTLTSQRYVAPAHVDRERRQFPPENPNHCVTLEVPTGTLTEARHPRPPTGGGGGESTGRSGRQNAATRRNMRREERVTVQGPVKRLQPDGMLHGGFRKGAQSSNARMDRNDNSAAEEQFRQWPPSHPPAGPNRTAFCFGPKVPSRAP